VYLKAPKKPLGGCAIWDLAAVALMVDEARGNGCTYEGGPLPLNRADSVFFNDIGFAFGSADVDLETLLSELRAAEPTTP
jgi:3'-phosphoadenosine 5'-phosphosulfate (PAPS) 3'-phosphatase